jgi:hypothetical protein
MPGRKIINVMTPFSMYNVSLGQNYWNSYERLADEALRSGVIINFLDIGGLENLGAQGSSTMYNIILRIHNKM